VKTQIDVGAKRGALRLLKQANLKKKGKDRFHLGTGGRGREGFRGERNKAVKKGKLSQRGGAIIFLKEQVISGRKREKAIMP